jgi:hypothetical protein
VTDILQIAPTFLAGASKLHDLLAGFTLVCAFCGLTIIAVHAFREKQIGAIWPMFVRMAVAVILLSSLGSWGDMLNSGVTELVSLVGWGQFPGGVAQDYQAAIARKWGSAGIQGLNQGASGFMADPSRSGQSSQGVKLSHYGYEKPGDPNYDSNSAQGIGAFTWDNTPGSLQNINASGVLAAALSPDVVQQYGVKPGQEFRVQTSGGDSLNLVYADNTASYLTGRVDVYDPQNTFGLDGAPVTSIAGGAVIEGAPGTASLGGFNLFNPSTWLSPIVNALVYLLSIAALVCMMIMTVVQQIFYVIEIALSPIFIGLWLIPGLSNLATRFFTSLAAICLWPLGWVVSDLVTKFFIDWAANSTGNTTQSVLNTGGTVLSGGTLAVAFWVLLALWVIGSSFVAPLIVSALIVTGGSGISKVFASTVGVTAYTAFVAARNAGLGAATSAIGSAISAPLTPPMALRPNYARRPMDKP